jgi:dihydroorotate dehydrogenase (fumarate)
MTKYAGLTLRNPLIAGSSGLTSSPEKIKEYEKAGIGAVVLKSLFEEQIEMQSVSLLKESDFPEAADYVREYVKANQVNQYLELIKKLKTTCTIPVIASVNCYKEDAWIDFAHQIELAGADAIELNVYYMPTDLVYDYEENRAVYVNIIRKVKEAVSIPVMMKIGKSFSNIPAVAYLLKVNGADGVVLFNRFYQPDININTMQLVSGNVFSNHSELSDTLRWTAIVSGKIPDISIASSTGVHDWEDVVKCLLAGASAVQIASALYTHGPEIISQILVCMEEWMNQTRYSSLSEFKGRLNYAQIESPNMYERAQFMKYFSNRD